MGIFIRQCYLSFIQSQKKNSAKVTMGDAFGNAFWRRLEGDLMRIISFDWVIYVEALENYETQKEEGNLNFLRFLSKWLQFTLKGGRTR